MKLWVDDLREPPAGWTWAKSSREAIDHLEFAEIGCHRIEAISLDHDLGGDDTTRRVVLWMCDREFWPDEVLIHTANPVGREWLAGMVDRYHARK